MSSRFDGKTDFLYFYLFINMKRVTRGRGGGAVEGVVTSYIWHSTDGRAE